MNTTKYICRDCHGLALRFVRLSFEGNDRRAIACDDRFADKFDSMTEAEIALQESNELGASIHAVECEVK